MDKLLDLVNKTWTAQLSRSPPGISDTVEFEIRLGKINATSYEASLSAFQSMNTIEGIIVHGNIQSEQSMSIISIDTSLGRGADHQVTTRKMHPDGQTVTLHKIKKGTYRAKEQVNGSICNFKMDLSIEHSQNIVRPQDDDMIRLRNRLSRSVVVEGQVWSIDITLVHETTVAKIRAHQDIKRQFFDDPNIASRIALATHYEVEAELKEFAPERPLTAQSIRAMAAVICKVAYPHGVDVGVAANDRELLLRSLARMISRASHRREPESFTLKNMLNNVIMMTKSMYRQEVYPMEGYFATDKTDGERGVAFIDDDNHITVVTDREQFGTVRADHIHTVYDGEVMVELRGDAGSTPVVATPSAGATSAVATAPTIAAGGPVVKFFAFDCLWIDGQSLIDTPFESRYVVIQEQTEEPSAGATGKTPRIEIHAKPFEELKIDSLQDSIMSLYQRPDRQYPIDGIIFTKPGSGYFDTKNYKWKPMENVTIDFLCFRCPDKLYGSAPYVLPPEAISLSASAKGRSDFRIYLLFCKCSEQQRAEFCISPLPFMNEILVSRPDLRGGIVHFACRFEPLAYILIVRLSDLEKFGGDIHGKVVEMRWRSALTQVDAESSAGIEHWRHWDIIRERPDRTVGNNIAVATTTFANYVNPFPLEALWELSDDYFSERTDEAGHSVQSQFLSSDKYRRFVLTMLFYEHISAIHDARILDLGGGRAEDFVRYALAQASLVVNFDADAMAIAESALRIESQVRKRPLMKALAAKWLQNLGAITDTSRPARDHSPHEATRQKCTLPAYIGRVVDVSTLTHEAFRTKLSSIGLSLSTFNIVISTFSFHYFCSSQETVERVFAMISDALNDTGMIIITTMSGEKVFNLLQENGGVWIRSEPNTTIRKYEIRAQYEVIGAKLAPFGQMIKVSVPFSNELYDEPLCNFEAVCEVAKRAGFNVVGIFPHDSPELLASFKRADSNLELHLTPLDREYSSLYMTYIFKRAVVAKTRAPKVVDMEASSSKLPGRRGMTRVSRVKKK